MTLAYVVCDHQGVTDKSLLDSRGSATTFHGGQIVISVRYFSLKLCFLIPFIVIFFAKWALPFVLLLFFYLVFRHHIFHTFYHCTIRNTGTFHYFAIAYYTSKYNILVCKSVPMDWHAIINAHTLHIQLIL